MNMLRIITNSTIGLIYRLHLLFALYIARKEHGFIHDDFQWMCRRTDANSKYISITYNDFTLKLPSIGVIPVLFDYGFSSVKPDPRDKDTDLWRALDATIPTNDPLCQEISEMFRKPGNRVTEIGYDTEIIKENIVYLVDTYLHQLHHLHHLV